MPRTQMTEHWLRVTGKHGAQFVDVVLLETLHGAFTWSVPALPPVSGHRPVARMNFAAHYVPQVRWEGGCLPGGWRHGRGDEKT
jgi:hypothetical protein